MGGEQCATGGRGRGERSLLNGQVPKKLNGSIRQQCAHLEVNLAGARHDYE